MPATCGHNLCFLCSTAIPPRETTPEDGKAEEINPCQSLLDGALLASVADGLLSRVQGLLANGANPSIHDEVDDPVLHRAVRNCQPEILIALIKAGANNEVGIIGSTALMWACCSSRRLECLEILLIAGKDCIDYQSPIGTTALHIAASMGNRAAVSLLLENGADRTLRDKQGSTAAQATCDKAIIELLRTE